MVMPFIGLWNLLVMPAGRDGTFAGRGGTFATGVLWTCFRVRWRLVVKMQFFACFVCCEHLDWQVWITKLPLSHFFPLNSPGARWFQGQKIRTDHLRAYHRGKGGTRRCALLGFGGFARLSQVAKRQGAIGCWEALEMLTWHGSKLFTPKLQKMKNWTTTTTTTTVAAFNLSLMLKSLECSWIGSSWCIFFALEAEQVNKIYERQLQEDRSNGNQCMYLAVVPASGQARPNTNPVMEFIMEKGLQASVPHGQVKSSCDKCWVKIFVF